MKKLLLIALFLNLSVLAFSQSISTAQKVDELIKQMTIEEKVGQLTQYSGKWDATGPISIKHNTQKEIISGQIGSMLNVLGSTYTRQYQELAMQSRLKIPLLFAQDVIHGFKRNNFFSIQVNNTYYINQGTR